MELIAKGKFYRDLSEIKNKYLTKAIYKTLKQIQYTKDISQIQQLRKLKKYKVYYRIKIQEDYRIGIIIRGNKIWLTCFGHRNNFYKKFP